MSMLRLIKAPLLVITLSTSLPPAFANVPATHPAANQVNVSPTTTTPSDKTNSQNQGQGQSSDQNQAQDQAQAFLEENKKKPGVVTLPSGLQYKILKEGAGQSPGPAEVVLVHYRGTLLDGKEFDSSYKKNQPIAFTVNRVISGWQEALQLMKPGSKWVLYIPPQLAYGEKGAGQLIPPNSLLIFEVELLSVKPSPDTDQDGVVEEWEGLD